MSSYLHDLLYKKFPIEMTSELVKQINIITQVYETRGTHALALNTSLLCVDPMFFLDTDNKNFFDLVRIDRKYFKNQLDTLPVIDSKNKVVISDPYNNLIIYLAHRTYVSDKLDEKEKFSCMMNLFKNLHYKFFTSFANHMLRFGADPSVMKMTIEKLTNKSDIVKYGTWKKVIEHRCENLILGKIDSDEDKKSIHINTIKNYNDDKAIGYCISDTQTRVRNKLKLVINAYHDNHKNQNTISNYSLASTIDGTKIINDVKTLESVVTSVSSQVLNLNTFIDNDLILFICSMFSNCRADMFREVLNKISQIAMIQSKEGTLDSFQIYNKNRTEYEGVRILINNIIQRTYRFCIKNRANLKNRGDILTRTKNLYSASRINDSEILDIKDSVHSLVLRTGETRRDATIVSIKIAFILYIMVKTFEYI